MDVNAINIKWTELFKPITGLKTDMSNRIIIERELIPIIFVPGIMGSRLKNRKGKKAWDPDDDGFMLKNYGRYDATADKRKRLLIGKKFNPDYLHVSNDDTEHNERFAHDDDSTRSERGWGGIFWSSYGDLLISLQGHDWKEPLSLCFDFPVHAFGYNWTDTNFNAGKKLAEKIDEIIAGYLSKDRLCKYVILVSHSMGGLVCRSACRLHGTEEKVLGVLHGVQPSTGAAAAYWRMKAGFERPHGHPSWVVWDWLRNPLKMAKHDIVGLFTSWTLGTDGEEVTSLLCNAPGGLELLPNKHYTNNEGKPQWLHIPDRDGVIASLPRNDPYEEIYRKKDDVFWRMVNPDWIDPYTATEENDASIGRKMKGDPWKNYLINLEKAEKLHELLNVDGHCNSYQFYSKGYDTVDEIRFKRQKVINWSGKGHESNIVVNSSNRGGCTLYLDYNDRKANSAKDAAYKIQMSMPDEYEAGGDSTVPESSGKALKVKKTEPIAIKLRNDWFKQDHQNIFKSKKTLNMVHLALRNIALGRIKEEIGLAIKSGGAYESY